MTLPMRVGLTGGIGSGKTAVSDMFADLGVPVIDADCISRELQRPGQPGFQAIVDLFGDDVVDHDGHLKRDYLRRLIFDNAALKTRLESVMHPLVRSEIEVRAGRARYPYCIVSIPLLFESGRQDSVDRILVVDVPEQVQVDRASKRDGTSPDQIRKIIAMQAQREIRLEQADDIICNERDLDHLRRQVLKLHDKYLSLASNSLK